MLLSICVPTYNRIDFLKEIISEAIEQLKVYELYNQVEIVVSNNCSTDETAAYLNGLIHLHPSVTFRINNNKENVGFVKNLIKTVEIAQAKYWWFIGDDDAIPNNALAKILEELNSHPQTPVFIFNQKGSKKINLSEDITIKRCAENYYYYMGNAVTICNTQLSRKVIDKNYESVIATCWPQTYLFFMAMHLSKEPLPVRVSTVDIFKYNIQNNTNSSYYYFDAQFFSLFRLGYSFAADSNNPDFINWFPKGIPFLHGQKKYEWAFAINKEYRFFDFEREKKEFDITYKEAKDELLPDHKKYLGILIQFKLLPNFIFKYYTLLHNVMYSFGYSLVKKKKLINPLSLYSTELRAFNTFKEEKISRKQLKHMHSTGKSDW